MDTREGGEVMNEKQTCYSCDYAFAVEELTDYVDAQFPEGIKLCQECNSKGGE